MNDFKLSVYIKFKRSKQETRCCGKNNKEYSPAKGEKCCANGDITGEGQKCCGMNISELLFVP